MAADKCGFLNEESQKYLDDLSEKIMDNQVVLFAGGGLSRNARRKDGALGLQFPLWDNLTTRMLEKLYGKEDKRVEKYKYDYLNIADKFEAEFGPVSLFQLMEASLQDSDFEPGRIHQLISWFNWEILTTNFDTLIERGFELTNKTPNLIISDSGLSNTEKPRIFKINGCIKHTREHLVITGEDFRTFSGKKPLIELFVKKCFIESTILFVGFSLNDPAFQMIHGWVRDRLLGTKGNRFAYSIQFYVDKPTRKIWIPRGIRFIELFPDGIVDDSLAEKRLYSLFYELYRAQIDEGGKKRDVDATRARQKKILKDLKEIDKSLGDLRDKAKESEKKSELHCLTTQALLKGELIKLFDIFPLEDITEEIVDDKETEKTGMLEMQKKIVNLLGKLSYFIRNYLQKKQKEDILLQLLKVIVGNAEKTDGKLFANTKATEIIYSVLKRFLIKDEQGVDDPNVWIIALYTAVRIGVSHKIPDVKFFRNGFSIIRKAALQVETDYEVLKNLHHYWLFSIVLFGPLICGETLLNICRKIQPQKHSWDIKDYIYYHLEAFFADRSSCRDLFLRAVYGLRTSDIEESFYKFLLLDTFFDELKENEFHDLFLKRTYEELSGKFRGEAFRFRHTLSSIEFPAKENYFKSVLQAIFNAADNGKSFMFTGLSDVILSFPKITIEERDIDALKQTSLCELFLLATIYDKPRKGREKEKELKNLITTMIDSGVIDVSKFLHFLLFRLEEANLGNMVQDIEVDNGISRYLNGLVTFISCALPYLTREDLLEIKKTIESCLTQVRIEKIREALIQVIAYILNQFPEEDFTTVLKTIFSLSAGAHFSATGLSFLKLRKKELSDTEIIRYSQLRLLLDRSLEEQGTPFDRDFVTFMLNHKRDELFPKDDRRINDALRTYFDFILQEIEKPSLQWLMDLQKFVEKGFIPLDKDMKQRVVEFIDNAFKFTGALREWKLKLFDGKMVKIYRTFAPLFKDEIIRKITDAYRRDLRTEVKEQTLNELDPEVQETFAHLLKEIYFSKHHNELSDHIIRNVKGFIKEDLAGGGHLGAFWEHLDKKEQSQLIGIMLNLWLPASEESILRAVKATGEFLKYKTDEEAMKELSNRLLYCIFSGSTTVKIEWCRVVAAHIKENSPWYTGNKAKILDCLKLFKTEKNLELLREFLELACLFKKDEIKETIDQLKENAPYAEIRRTAKRM